MNVRDQQGEDALVLDGLRRAPALPERLELSREATHVRSGEVARGRQVAPGEQPWAGWGPWVIRVASRVAPFQVDPGGGGTAPNQPPLPNPTPTPPGGDKGGSPRRSQIASGVTSPHQGECQHHEMLASTSPHQGECQHQGMLANLHALFFRQLEFCQYEIIPGPEKKLRWGVNESTRDPASGMLLHDDLVISAALLAVLDSRPWNITSPAALIPAADPLEDMKRF